jgi:hypothetical protein
MNDQTRSDLDLEYQVKNVVSEGVPEEEERR